MIAREPVETVVGLKKNVNVRLADLSGSLQKQLGAKADASIGAQAKWKANLIRTKDTNQGNAIAAWSKDVFFAQPV